MPDQGGRSHFAIQFGGDKFSPEDLGLALSCGWLRNQREKSYMIRVRFVDQLVEAIFLDVSSLVPQRTARSTEGWLGESVVAQIQSLLCGASCLSSCRQSGAPFKVTQLVALTLFALLAIVAAIRFRNEQVRSARLAISRQALSEKSRRGRQVLEFASDNTLSGVNHLTNRLRLDWCASALPLVIVSFTSTCSRARMPLGMSPKLARSIVSQLFEQLPRRRDARAY
jgi:hypothetical protein